MIHRNIISTFFYGVHYIESYYWNCRMKFTAKIVVILFIVLICLAIFLYNLNELTKKQQKEEEENQKIKLSEIEKTREARIQRKLKKNEILETFLSAPVPFSEADTAYGDKQEDQDELQTKDKPPEDEGCPNILINRGDKIVLYNSKKPGVAVEIFNNLDEYAAYVYKQQVAGVNCPVLYLRKEIDLQGRDAYRMYPFYIPHQLPLYDQYSMLSPPTTGPPGTTADINEPSIGSIRPLPSVHYPTRDGDLWSNGGFERPSIPMPPPFLKSLSTWEIHHMPPLYVEGSLPSIPIEKNRSAPNAPEIPRPMNDSSVAGKPAIADFLKENTNDNIKNYDPYGIREDAYISSDKYTTPPKGKLSDNAADTNWGGRLYTMANVESGKYDNNVVKPALYPNLGYV